MHCKRKILLGILVAGLILSGWMCGVFLDKKFDEIYYLVGTAPSGVNISIYNGEYSRGFSWWTQKSKDSETELYISETSFEEEHLSTAIEVPGDIGGQHFDGIFLIKGQSRHIEDSTRWGRTFFISYCNHTVAVENLHHAQAYYYALGGNGEYIYGEFETDSDDETIIINFNDFQTSDGEKLHFGGNTLQAALQCTTGPLDFFAFGGDFTGVFSIGGQSYSYLSGWIKSRDSLTAYTSSIPMVMAPGNHDRSKDLFVSNNMVSYHGSTDTGGYWSFDYNNVHFVVLNTNEFDKVQYAWVQEDLAQANLKDETDWIILMLHKGPYTTGDHGYSMEHEYIEAIGQLASEYHVDMVMQAHDHTFSKTYPYCWDSTGYTENELDETVVNRKFRVMVYEGMEYHCDPRGTYYISCGASGHRLGENRDYALSYGEKSYTNRFYKVAVSEIRVYSKYADIGMPASMDLGYSMFGIMQIRGNSLVYDFYVVENGSPILIDRLAILKSGNEG